MAAHGATSLKVLSYNIHRAIGVDRRFRPERIIEILSHHDADVVLLQEVDEGAPRSRELDLARELAAAAGYPHFAVGHNVSLRKGRYGNATLSRHPILRERNIDLSVPESWIRRGCQHTTVLVGEGQARLEVFNLHLGLSARERRKQVGLLARCSELSGLDDLTPTIVGGDFNDWRSLLWPLFTNGLGFQSATDSRKGRRRALATYPAFSPQGALDRIYFRGPLRLTGVHRCRLHIARMASDHLPVMAELDLLP